MKQQLTTPIIQIYRECSATTISHDTFNRADSQPIRHFNKNDLPDYQLALIQYHHYTAIQ
jgi:hypothetical protein